MKFSIAWIASKRVTGSSRVAILHPSTIRPSNSLIASNAGFTGSPPNGPKPATKIFRTLHLPFKPYFPGNAKKYIKQILTISKGTAVITWARMTPFLSDISSNAAGTTLKLAAIGVINVPQ